MLSFKMFQKMIHKMTSQMGLCLKNYLTAILLLNFSMNLIVVSQGPIWIKKISRGNKITNRYVGQADCSKGFANIKTELSR